MMLYLRRVSNLQGVDDEGRERKRESERKWEKKINRVAGS